MAHIEIPALYRLDVGSSKWGWHKMADLVEAVDNLLARSSLDRLGAGEESYLQVKADYMFRVRSGELLERFGHLNKGKRLTWSDGHEIEVDLPKDVPEALHNLYVPAQWGMRVIEEIKRLIEMENKKARSKSNK